MSRYFIFTIILSLLLSCSNENGIVLYDEYFSSLYNLDEGSKGGLLYLKSKDESLKSEDYAKYNQIYITEFVYNQISIPVDIENKILILNSNTKDLSAIQFSSVKAYQDLVKELTVSKKYISIGAVLDYQSDINKIEADVLKNGLENIDIFYVTDTTSHNDLKKYVDNNKKDFWILGSVENNFYLYELIKDIDILILNSCGLEKFDYNIKFAINLNLVEELSKFNSGNSSEISRALIKYNY